MQISPESQQLRVTAAPHPFKLANQEYSFAPAPTLSLTQILQEVQPDVLLRRRAHIWVNDDYISPEKWDSTFPEGGSDIAIRVVPSGGVGRIIGMVFVAIAAIVAAAFLGPLMAGLMGFGSPVLWGGLIGLAVGVVGNMALNALFPPVRPGGTGTLSSLAAAPGLTGSDYGQSSPTLSITGAQNKANLWGPVPFILGRFRVAPFYGARVYTESAGGDQYLRLLFIWCFGPVQLEDLRIADTLLENYQGVEVEHRNLTLLLSAQTIAIDVTAKTLTRTSGSWLMDGIKAGNTVTLGGCTTGANDTDYLISAVTGLVLTFTTSTATTTEAGNGAQTASITYGDDPVTLYPVTIEEEALSIELLQNEDNIHTSELDADELSIDVACNSLMGVTAQGGTYAMTVNFTVTYRETGTSGAWLTPSGTDGAGNPATAIAMTGNTKSAVRGNLRWKPPARGQYDIKVKRTTAPDSIWTSSVSYWVALRTIKNEDPIDFPFPLAKTAMRIKASGQLNGTVDEFKGTLTSICPDWEPDESSSSSAYAGTWITRATQNPASLYRLVLQGIQNQKALADSRIDLLNLQYWHEYCETQAWKFNKYIDYTCTVEDLLREIAAAARSAFSRIDSKVGVIIDEPQAFTIGPAFTPRNILKNSFQSTITIVDRPHAFRCPFINEDMQYQQDERIVLSDGYQIDDLDAWGVSHPEYPAATIFEQLDLPGVTDPELIFRHARYHYAVATLRCETAQFGADIEWMVATRGDRIKFAHDVMLAGLSWGRVKSLVMETMGDPPVETGALAGVTTDELLPMAAGSYVLRFRLADNTSLLCPIVTAAGEPKEATFITPIAAINDWPAVGDLFLFGEAGLEAIDLIIKSIQPNSDLSATVIAVPYDENIYLADVGTVPVHDPKISVPVEWWSPVISWIRSDGTVLFPIPGGGWQSRILVTLLRPSVLDSQITGVEAQFWVTGSGEAAITLPVVPLDAGEVSILPVTDGQSYDFQLRYVKKDGSRGPWADIETEVVEGKTAPPENVTGFSIYQVREMINFVWTENPDLDIAGYELRYGAVGVAWAESILITATTLTTNFTTPMLSPGQWDFLIKAIDTTGNYSETETRKSYRVVQFYQVLAEPLSFPLWAGTPINMFRNPLTGHLIPEDRALAADYSDSWEESGESSGAEWDVFDMFVMNPHPTYGYEAPEIDLGADIAGRAWGRIYSDLGPGETGATEPEMQLDYRVAAGSYDGFEDWIIGSLLARYAKFKVLHTAANGDRLIKEFQPVIDKSY